MADRLTIDAGARDAYWSVIEACLRSIFNKTDQEARSLTADYRRAVEDPMQEPVGDLIYHEEPFSVACDLAQVFDVGAQESLLRARQSDYEVILRQNHWAP